jgi:dTDP-4-dehydrorhamnose 3,5-epimerase-like enzyme
VNNWSVPGLIDIPTIRDTLGALGVIERDVPFPFDLKRVYFLYDVPADTTRGSHAHKSLHQLIVPVSGSFVVNLEDGHTRSKFDLTNPARGLIVPPGYWRTLNEFSSGSAAVVFASEEYDPDDYIRDYDEFLLWARA